MNPILRNIIAVLAGLMVGGTVNKLLIDNSSKFIPLPPGIDPNDLESLINNMHLFEPKNFIMPFLAHALGTLVASIIISRFAASQHLRLALIPGFIFLIGGIIMSRMVDAPTWFDGLDLLVAYLLMAFLGYLIGRKK